MAGASEIGEFAWEFENLLNQVLEGRIEPTGGLMDLIAEGIRALPSMRARLAESGEAELDETACRQLAERAQSIAEGRETVESLEAGRCGRGILTGTRTRRDGSDPGRADDQGVVGESRDTG
jgi:chemotaxis protein histidine kinase CheA